MRGAGEVHIADARDDRGGRRFQPGRFLPVVEAGVACERVELQAAKMPRRGRRDPQRHRGGAQGEEAGCKGRRGGPPRGVGPARAPGRWRARGSVSGRRRDLIHHHAMGDVRDDEEPHGDGGSAGGGEGRSEGEGEGDRGGHLRIALPEAGDQGDSEAATTHPSAASQRDQGGMQGAGVRHTQEAQGHGERLGDGEGPSLLSAFVNIVLKR